MDPKNKDHLPIEANQLIDSKRVAWVYVRKLAQAANSPRCVGPYHVQETTGFCLCGCVGRYARASWMRKAKGIVVKSDWMKSDTEAIAVSMGLVNRAVKRGDFVPGSMHLKGKAEGCVLFVAAYGFEFEIFSTRQEFYDKATVPTA